MTIDVAETRTFRWTREEYYRLADEGYFNGRHVQLIDGEIIEMAPQKHSHTWAVSRIRRFLESVFREGYWVREEKPLHLGPRSEPEPDVAVVEGDAASFEDHPTSALLVVEVSDTTIALDRTKAHLYASWQIPEYWLVNLREKRVYVHRSPVTDISAPLGHRYESIEKLEGDQNLSPLGRPAAKLMAAELFK